MTEDSGSEATTARRDAPGDAAPLIGSGAVNTDASHFPPDMSDPSMKVQAFGRDPDAAMGDIGEAALSLLNAVTVEMFGAEAAEKIMWRVGDVRWCCDLCGVEAEHRPDDWQNDGYYDYCAACTQERGRGASEEQP